MKQYLELLQNPPASARGWTRWWWFGCAVTREEIARELRYMRDAQLGGVEIQILYPLAADDPAKKIHNISYFSPEFFEILRYTVETANQLGLEVDFTLGSSWPYGGPFVPPDMAVQSVTPWQIDVTGPQADYSFDCTCRVTGQIVRVVMGRMVHSRMLEDTVVDITDHLRDKELYGWPWGKVLEHLTIPEGDWKIVVFAVSDYHQSLVVASRDAQGLVIDHCRRDVTDFYLANAAAPLVEQLKPLSLRCIFCDSIELEGNNWTAPLLEEFQKRRGYDLSPYLYALWGAVGDIGDRVRYDYFLTMSELTLENFFDRLTQWCHAHQLRSRIQAHGTWADILKAYACADIPEGETFGPQDYLFVNSIHRRFASSAGHLYGRPIISNESFTWLRVPRFLETMEQLKAATDAILLDGMNAIYNHGYAYSPPEAGSPGWPFYASSQINHTNPYWDCYPELGRYIQRTCALLQQGYACNEVAIYLPQADIWSDNLMADLHMAMKLQEHFGWDVPDAISKAGYSFDYVNDDAITHLAVMDGGMHIGSNVYRAILLIGCTRLPPETAASLEAFVASGGILLATEAPPSRSCGLLHHPERDAAVQSCMDRVFPRRPDTFAACGKGRAAVASDRRGALLALLAQALTPDVSLSQGAQVVGYQHRRVPEGDIYFLANVSAEPQKTTAIFHRMHGGCAVQDAMNAQPFAVEDWQDTADGVQLSLVLPPFASIFVLFGGELGQPVRAQSPREAVVTLPGPWQLEIPDAGFSCTQAQPSWWQQYDPVRYFSGLGTYRTRFTLPQTEPAARLLLELEQMATTARVRINGADCGKLWKRPWLLDITDAVRPGENTLEICCGNQLINAALAPDADPPLYDGPLVEGWPYFSASINQIRRRRIGMERERAAVSEPQNSGLSGPVRIRIQSFGS